MEVIQYLFKCYLQVSIHIVCARLNVSWFEDSSESDTTRTSRIRLSNRRDESDTRIACLGGIDYPTRPSRIRLSTRRDESYTRIACLGGIDLTRG